MKSLFKFSRMALSVVAVAAATAVQAATPVSPVFTNGVTGWDCLMSGQGSRQGVMYLTFNSDNSFTYAMIGTRTGYPKNSNVRSGTGSVRGPEVPSISVTNTAGFVGGTGFWTYDVKGYTVGSFWFPVLVDGTSTNTVTNTFSFKAKITPSKRLTGTYSSSMEGNGTVRGVPIQTVTDLSGTWSGEEKSYNTSVYEWYSLTPQPSIWPNIYAVDGYGPSYDLGGYCIVSSQKRIAFGNWKSMESGTNVFFTARGTIGSFINKPTMLGGKTKGQMNFGTNIVTYDTFRVGVPPT